MSDTINVKSLDSVVRSVVSKFVDRAKFGLEKYGTNLDREDLQTVDWIKSIVTLFSPIFSKSFKTTLTSDKLGTLLYILEKETTLLIAPTNSLMLVLISALINLCISSEIFIWLE